jgi:hypothetical protein
MFISHYQTAERNHNMKVASKFLQNMAQFKCLGMVVTNQNCMNGKN